MSSRPALSIVDHDQSAREGIARPALVTQEKRANPAEQALSEIAFGPFRLFPTQFLLLEGDKPVPLGSRALEILVVLLERPGELVSKQELMTRVWPNIFVGPANLTVHISTLRRTLRDGRDGNRFIINIPGRGYSFVASVEVSGHENLARGTASRRAQRPLLESAVSPDPVQAFPDGFLLAARSHSRTRAAAHGQGHLNFVVRGESHRSD
jgi:DNA-binding winged helix-turn-helix (wHTH) protein